jgi:hypothetical protein
MMLGLLVSLALAGGVVQTALTVVGTEAPPGYNVWMEMARVGACALIFLMFCRVPQPELRRLPINLPYVAYLALIWPVLLVLIMFLPRTVPVLLALWILGGILWMADLRRAPDAFALEPQDGQTGSEAASIRDLPPAIRAAPAAAAVRERTDEVLKADRPSEMPVLRSAWSDYRPTRWSLHVTVWEILNSHWNIWIQLPIIALYSGICFGAYQTGEDLPLWVMIALAMWVGTVHSAAEYMHPLDHLPIPRRALFWHAAGTGLAAALVGALVGLQIAGVLGPHKPSDIRFDDREIQVPIEFWEIVESGTPPAVVAPWGERYEPEAQRTLLSRTRRLYNPYGNTWENSDRFIAFQMRRAATKLYGDLVPGDWPGSVEQVEPPFTSGVERGSFTPDELRGYFSVVRSRVYAVVIALFFLGATPLALLLFGRLHPGATGRTKTALWLSGLIPALLLLVLMFFSDPSSKAGSRTLYGYPMIYLRRWMEGVNIPPGLLWLGTLAVAAGCLLLFRAFFGRVEAVTTKVSRKIEEDL